MKTLSVALTCALVLSAGPTLGQQIATNRVVEVVNPAQTAFESILSHSDRSWLPSNISVQIDQPGPEIGKGVWLTAIQLADNGQMVGTVSSAPRSSGYAIGEMVTFSSLEILDWSFEQDGQIYGNFALRAMLPEMTSTQLAVVNGYLAPTTLPEDW